MKRSSGANLVRALAGASLVALLFGAVAAAQMEAVAELRDESGTAVGVVVLTEVEDGVALTGDIRGLTPGRHGFHIHAVGVCEPPFASAGAHFNPADKQHGIHNPAGAHLGDLPNLLIGPDGAGSVNTVAHGVTLREGPTSLFDRDGRALVIHADEDDDVTDPTGNSGARIACGVVIASPAAP